MGEPRFCGGRRHNWSTTHFTRFALDAGIHKNDGSGAADIFCQFGQELLQLHDLDFRRRQLAAKLFGNQPAHTVVAAQWIAVRDYENPGHAVFRIQSRTTSSSISPLGLSS